MPSEKVIKPDPPKTVDLLQAKEQLDRTLAAFRRAVLGCDGETWLPPEFELDAGETPALAMAAKWVDIYKAGKDASVQVPTGLLCASELLEHATAVNEAKETLKGLVVALRAALKPDDVREQLRTVGMIDYDLNKTYQRVMVLPHRIQSISWTWAVGHRKVEPVTVRELRRRAYDQSERIQAAILEDLQPYTDATELARVKTRDVQLRANIHRLIQGEWERKAIVTPGPILLNQATLPGTIVWRPEPPRDDKGRVLVPERKSRSDQVLSATPACTIDGVEYFAYLTPPKTVKRKADDVPT